LVATVLLPTPPLGLATTITGMRTPPAVVCSYGNEAAHRGYGNFPKP
jgi:hypothetical protein